MIYKHELNEKDIEEINRDKQVCIYGAGIVAKAFGARLTDILGIHLDFFCDRDKEKWNKEIIPFVKCISPEELKTKDKVVCFVLVGQHYTQSALDDLGKYENIDWIVTYDDLLAMDRIVEGVLSLNDSQAENKVTPEHDWEDGLFVVPNISGKRIAVYTCITGEYDEIQQPGVMSDELDYFCIMDGREGKEGAFQLIDAQKVVPECVTDNTRRNRFCKIMGSHLFKNYEYSIYIDGNIRIVGEDLSKYISRINKHGFMSHSHAFEDCIYAEAVRVIINGKEEENTIKAQMARYRNEGMPRHYGMLHNAVLVRENNNPVCRTLMTNWWNEVFYSSRRDQLSLTYCLWKMGIKPQEVGILGPNMRANGDFVWVNRHL